MRSPLLYAALLLCAGPALAGDWPQWRGPAGTGASPETGLPTTWSTTEGVRWTTPLPGFSGATPVISGDTVFVSSPDAERNLCLLAINRADGKVRWQQTLATGDIVKSRTSPNMASPSPVTDGTAVWVLFGTGQLAALDFAGQKLWERNLAEDFGRFAHMWLYGSSPYLHAGRLYVQVLQRDPVPDDYTHALDGKPRRESFVLCLDARTGKDVWKHARPTDALKESMESYATPLIHEHAGRAQLLIHGGDYLTSHDPATGAERWRVSGFNPKKGEWMRIVTSPVAWKGLVFAAGPKRMPLFGIRTDGSGDVTASHVAWSFDEFPPDVCTPAVHGDRLYVLDGDKRMLTCLHPETGAKLWQGDLGVRENFKASPTVADGRVFCISERGTVVVCDAAGGEFKVLQTIAMGGGEPTRSSVAVAGGELFIRTAERLVCVGK